MKSTRYTIKEFNAQFPTEEACLEYIWQRKYPGGLTCSCGKRDGFYRVRARKCYSCSRCGRLVSPCEGTIFHKSRTKLRTWFFAIFLMTASKNGVSAMELERQTGVTYKTAWRMAHQIRKLMTQGGDMLTGVVEADEAYFGGTRRTTSKPERKVPVIAMVERGGGIRAKRVPLVNSWQIKQLLEANVEPGSKLMTDGADWYPKVAKPYDHQAVNHGAKEYVRADVHTNSVEGFWSQLKRSINGTFHQVSRTHLQAYVDEFAFRYNHRERIYEKPIFGALIPRVGQRLSQVT